MNVRLAKKVLSSVAASAAILSVLAACDLGLAPYEPQVDAGANVPFDSGPITVTPEAGPVDAGTDANDGGVVVKRVFVSSARTRGNIGGQAGGDNLCQTLASQAALGGRFVAWLSESTKPAIDHIVDVGPWFLVDRRTPVFANKLAITTPGPANPIDRDEKNTALGSGIFDTTRVWTGTRPTGLSGGAPVNNTCNDWTNANNGPLGLTGDYDKKNADWTQRSDQGEPCDLQFRIYCFEQ